MPGRVDRGLRFAAALLCSGLATGCATFQTLQKLQDPKDSLFYAGTRLDWAAIRQDYETLDRFALRDVHPPGCPSWDLPASFIADTVLSPRTIWTIGAVR